MSGVPLGHQAAPEPGALAVPDALAFVDDLRAQAKELGLWNLFFPHLCEDEPGTDLSNYAYAPIFEEMAKLPCG